MRTWLTLSWWPRLTEFHGTTGEYLGGPAPPKVPINRVTRPALSAGRLPTIALHRYGKFLNNYALWVIIF